jgi:hypothetical protein
MSITTTRAVASSALLCLLLATTAINHGCCANKQKSHKAHQGGGYTTNNNGSSWLNARATWYGACGFKNVHMPPFSAMTSCGNDPIFKDGLGCGSCYQVFLSAVVY